MSQNIKPGLGYVYAKEVEELSGAIISTEISDTKQKYVVIAIGAPRLEELRVLSHPSVAKTPLSESFPGFKVGDTVLVEKHAAEGNTPTKMLSAGYALFSASRVMAVVEAKDEA